MSLNVFRIDPRNLSIIVLIISIVVYLLLSIWIRTPLLIHLGIGGFFILLLIVQCGPQLVNALLLPKLEVPLHLQNDLRQKMTEAKTPDKKTQDIWRFLSKFWLLMGSLLFGMVLTLVQIKADVSVDLLRGLSNLSIAGMWVSAHLLLLDVFSFLTIKIIRSKTSL